MAKGIWITSIVALAVVLVPRARAGVKAPLGNIPTVVHVPDGHGSFVFRKCDLRWRDRFRFCQFLLSTLPHIAYSILSLGMSDI